ncbi:hypothetical protein PFAG_04372 [Plasmodium falciparum Santa Lucia]|uniref:Uncharacterized protein n=13 Tax=Plasmodium falciparum TaxID=5833 RepID=W7KBP6_PLAFO|nr:hypothetical protein PFFVO_03972 [Plasmodium falciparum Vietnam Oak-Knoll (FVO)]ETW29701.1 hypothetical protein PFFCH_02971 [Plasmodium falciparum FCH/4]ETW34908.1 hypothetical protein PFTANZ_04343 [Plasmodium falciparum Tanzania (2000708)]ETW40894.1 hypothetical protein PFNF135_04534 [Plasmodium falciparum NF135/5.C10]ETW47823.1 hypothetical protein PFMALIP_04222 [Plasmodium falciparum MaliPS096_E11]ETW54762.1 hypothetical protein PFUGPA_03364 [Plasmodium falciparum Palo Alto/Uganda]ETW59
MDNNHIILLHVVYIRFIYVEIITYIEFQMNKLRGGKKFYKDIRPNSFYLGGACNTEHNIFKYIIYIILFLNKHDEKKDIMRLCACFNIGII